MRAGRIPGRRNCTMEKSEKKVYGFLIRTKEEVGLYGAHELTITLDTVSIESGYKIRNLSRSYGEEPLADFQVKAYVTEKYDGVTADGAYFDCYKVDKRDAKNMMATFAKLDKGCDKLNAQFGYARDYGAQVARIATALGVTSIIRTKPSSSSSYDDQSHQHFTIGQGVSVLNTIVEEFRTRHPLPVEVSAA